MKFDSFFKIIIAVPPHHEGVVFSFRSGLLDKIHERGTHFKIPFIHQAYALNLKPQKMSVCTPATSKDGKRMLICAKFSFHTPRGYASLPFIRTIGRNGGRLWMPYIIADAIQSVVSTFSSSEVDHLDSKVWIVQDIKRKAQLNASRWKIDLKNIVIARTNTQETVKI
jgi:hypothetical protein